MGGVFWVNQMGMVKNFMGPLFLNYLGSSKTSLTHIMPHPGPVIIFRVIAKKNWKIWPILFICNRGRPILLGGGEVCLNSQGRATGAKNKKNFSLFPAFDIRQGKDLFFYQG
jgi:hypothetical protein